MKHYNCQPSLQRLYKYQEARRSRQFNHNRKAKPLQIVAEVLLCLACLIVPLLIIFI